MNYKKLIVAFIFLSFSFHIKPAHADIVPDIYDDFSDGKYQSRTGTDPWGRALPEWTVEQGAVDASAGYLVAASLSSYEAIVSTPTNTAKGTWIFKYKYLNADANLYNYCPSSLSYCMGITARYLNSSSGDLHLNNPIDGHWWVDYSGSGRFPHSGYIINMVGSQISPSMVGGSTEHEVIFIKDDKGYVYTWLDGKFVRWSTDLADEMTSSTKFLLNFEDMGSAPLTYPVAISKVEIYKDKYLPPANTAAYDSANQVIKITGWGVTLSDIATIVNDPTIFSYDVSTHTAIAYKDILVDRGSKLELSNETLLMNSASDGERKIKYYTDAIFDIENSAIDSTDSHYFLFQRLTDGGDQAYKNTFRIINSTINNAGGIYLERPVVVDIENSHFTNLTGSTPFQIYFRWPARELTVKNSVFSGKLGTENVAFIGGDQFSDLSPEPVGMDIVDCDFSNVVLQRSSDANTYHSYTWTEGTVNLINTKTNALSYAAYSDPTFPSGIIRKKYYLDVRVVDQNGNPINGANATVANETDNANHPAENLSIGKSNFQLANQKTFSNGASYFDGQTANWTKGWDDVNNVSTAVTGADGHIPLPSDANHALMITNSESISGASTSFTYTITAEKNGRIGTVTGVAPSSSWYRTDPNTRQNTVTVVIDTAVANSETWYPAPFAYRKTITIDHTKVANTDQPNFPVLVSLTDDNLKSIANGGKINSTNGYDIIFTLGDSTTKLDHEIEKYDPTTGELKAWVRIPNLSASSDTAIYIYYGNPYALTSQENKTGVWDGDFKVVQHMNQNPAGSAHQMKDSTANHNDGTSGGNMLSGNLIDGQIGKALSFDGSDDSVDCGSSSSLNTSNAMTIDAWINVSNKAQQRIVTRNWANSGSFLLWYYNGSLRFETISTDGTQTNDFISDTTVPVNTWVHVAGTMQPNSKTIYINGDPHGTLAYTKDITVSAGSLQFSGGSLQGDMDEVRISDIARSADWIKTEYNNESDPTNFVALSTSAEDYMHHFTITGSSTQTSGSTQTITVTAINRFGNKDTAYTGDKAITLTGANIDGTSTPYFTDKNNNPINFNSSGVIHFSNGTATASIGLYKAESVTINISDGIYSSSGDNSYGLNVIVPGSSGGSGGGGGGGSSSGGGTTSTAPTILKTEIKSITGNSLILNLSVTNATQMTLSDNSSFTGSTWVTYATTPTYIKKDNQSTLYLKFKSTSGIISQTVTLSIPTNTNNNTNNNSNTNTTTPPSLYSTGTLLKLSSSPRVYVVIQSKKKWISTPEVFTQLGYQWTSIQTISDTTLKQYPDYEDNLIRQRNDYKVYLVVNGVKRHIPNPPIFLDYGFLWTDVVDTDQVVIDKYKDTYLIKESGKEGIYYINPQGIRKLIPTTDIFNSYNDKMSDVQIVSNLEMESYPLSNLIRLNTSNDVYLIQGNIKKHIPNVKIANKYKLNLNQVMSVNQQEYNFYQSGGELK